MSFEYPLVNQICSLLGNGHFPLQLSAACKTANIEQNGLVALHIEASLGPSKGPVLTNRVLLGTINLHNGQVLPPTVTTDQTRAPYDYNRPKLSHNQVEAVQNKHPSSHDPHSPPSPKRYKTVSGLSPVKSTTTTAKPTSEEEPLSIRQVHTKTRLPQRKKPVNDAPVLEPTSTDKLIAGIWRQLYSPVQLTRSSSIIESSINIRTGVSGEVFRAVNILCMKYYNQSQSSRALEMIVQAYWIECYEARLAVIRLENPHYSSTEVRMAALKETCAVLKWKEKDLRNRMFVLIITTCLNRVYTMTNANRAIWRGYKEIKDAGGWASLIFASTGVYRFCKYRTGFGDGFATRLRHLRSAFEVAADTLHPEWRDLLRVIGQDEPCRYHGHPHEWVIVPGGELAVSLSSTYGHLNLPHGFQYRFIDDCELDERVFGTGDPRVVAELEATDTCQVCKEKQSDEIEMNQCSCFPTLLGGVRGPAPVQIFHTANGKNNGVVARYSIDRGTAVGEFVGLVTNGIHGVDVMVGGTRPRTYQIFQGQMGNFTRFMNHSCRPNSQFQKFYWRGRERILVVSRGIAAGSEITVDYSDSYWKQLDKRCLCGEYCCRFGRAKCS